MYFIVSWNIKATGQTWDYHNRRMRQSFEHCSYVNPINSVYFVKVTASEQYEQINQCLLTESQNLKIDIRYVITRPFDSSPQNNIQGWLEKDMMAQIGEVIS
jgi:hypothetical protein